ncbi:5895_t:CDS:2 [Dentiscutata erythropus]|uniref:5895_t:CDS:1 n=1 Tax=Dentiscutata erythropus TaxID=1348616 RepID=A0A9N9E392_9GLOM|nr:5895_t:CDS:2 [Dentiscutata erythropus]
MPKSPIIKILKKNLQFYRNNKKEELSLFQRVVIITLVENNIFQNKIASTIGILPDMVSKIINKFKRTSIVEDLKRSGYPYLLSIDEERKICEMITSRKCEIATEIYSIVKKRHSALTDKNKENQLRFAEKYKDWTVDDWKKVIFSDKSKFALFGAFKGRHYHWRKPLTNAYVVPTKQLGSGSIMVWGCITPDNCCLELVEETLNVKGYIKILKNCLIDVHVAIAMTRWLNKKDISVLEWPTYSLDPNLIEHL